LIALRTPVAAVGAVRSTLLQSSLNALRARGHYDRYLKLLDAQQREIILGTLAPEWLPISTGIAHYRACDELLLTTEELANVGEDVGNRIQGTFIGTIVRRARAVGLTPWVPLGQFERLWERLMQGGGVALYRTGPKDVRIEVHKLPLARFGYFRAAFCGVIGSGIKVGSGRAVTVVVAKAHTPEEVIVFRASWV
jgi:hypothetical protein